MSTTFDKQAGEDHFQYAVRKAAEDRSGQNMPRLDQSKLTGRHVAWNSVTGLRWDGKGFNSPKVATTVSAAELLVLKHTFENVESYETSL